MYNYQKNNRYFAQVEDGLKDLAAEELAELEADNIRPSYGGIYFGADKKTLYHINYHSRLATRILAPLVSFECTHPRDIYRFASQIKWTDFFSTAHSYGIFSTISSSPVGSAKKAGSAVTGAISDWFRSKFGMRPDLNRETPDVWLNLHIRKDRAAISLDTSGSALFQRGYRKAAYSGPIKETVAAAVIRLIQWNGEHPLYDPMCGSGTFLIESLMDYCRIPAGILRKRYGFEFLPDYDPEVWGSVKSEASRRIRELPRGFLGGSDISAGAVAAARVNCATVPFGDRIDLSVKDIFQIKGPQKRVIVTLPPYDTAVERRPETKRFYGKIGKFIMQHPSGTTAFVYFGNGGDLDAMRLKPQWHRSLDAGGINGILAKFEVS